MRDAIGRRIPRMPTLADLNRGEDEAYERGVQEQIDRADRHAETRTVIPAKDATND